MPKNNIKRIEKDKAYRNQYRLADKTEKLSDLGKVKQILPLADGGSKGALVERDKYLFVLTKFHNEMHWKIIDVTSTEAVMMKFWKNYKQKLDRVWDRTYDLSIIMFETGKKVFPPIEKGVKFVTKVAVLIKLFKNW